MWSAYEEAGWEQQQDLEQRRQEEETMPSINDVYSGGGDTLKAADLGGKSARAKIEGYEIREFDETNRDGQAYKSKKIVLSFVGKEKKLVVNKTNGLTIASNIGSDEIDDWIGKEIVMYSTKVSFGDKMVDAIRVRQDVPQEDLDDPIPF